LVLWNYYTLYKKLCQVIGKQLSANAPAGGQVMGGGGVEQIFVNPAVFFIKTNKYNPFNFGGFRQGVANSAGSDTGGFEFRVAVNARAYTWKGYAFKPGPCRRHKAITVTIAQQ
jgi:hypothetical protein